MRIFLSILSFALLVNLLFSCGDDEVSPLVNTWTQTLEIYSNCDDADSNGTKAYDCAGSIDDCVKYTFTKEGNFVISFAASGRIEGTYTVSNDQITITINDFQKSKIFYSYVLDGNTLTLTQNYDGCDIVKSFVKS